MFCGEGYERETGAEITAGHGIQECPQWEGVQSNQAQGTPANQGQAEAGNRENFIQRRSKMALLALEGCDT